MTTATHVAGLPELLKTLQTLPLKLGKKAIYASLREAGNVVRDEARARAPVLQDPDPYRTPGTVRRAIGVQRSKVNKGRDGLWQVIVRVRPLKKGKGAKNPKDPYYWWWVEFGTAKMPARPFLRPAFASTQSKQLSVLRVRFYRELGEAVLEARRGS